MVKQDVLDAINATIVENNKKGINARSLNNILTMMVENAGESGSGDGAIKVRVLDIVTILYANMFAGSYPDNAGLQTFLSTGEFSPTTWADIKIVFNAFEEGLGDSMDPVIAEMFVYNAEVYTQLVQKVESNEGVLTLADMSQLISVTSPNSDGTPSVSSMGFPLVFTGAHETDDSGNVTSSYDMLFTFNVNFGEEDFVTSLLLPFELKEDGSLLYDMSAAEVPDKNFIIPENGYVLTDERKAEQATFLTNCYDNYWSIKDLKPNITINSSGLTLANKEVSLLYKHSTSTTFTAVYYYNNTIKQVDIASDGTTTITTLGTLTA